MSIAPMAPNVAPAWPVLNTQDSIRSYSADTARGSSPSTAPKTRPMSPCGPTPTPSSPPSVSRISTCTSVRGSDITPLASPISRPQSCLVVRLRYPVTFTGAPSVRGSGSLLGASRRHARDQETLREDEDDQHRQHGDDGRQGERRQLHRLGSRGARVERRGRGEQRREADLDRVAVAPGQHHEGQEEVVPVLHEAEERDQGDDR